MNPNPTEGSATWRARWLFWIAAGIMGGFAGLLATAGWWGSAVFVISYAWWVGAFPGFQRNTEQAGYDRAVRDIEEERGVTVIADRCPMCVLAGRRGLITVQCYEHGVIVSP